jgi:hypothetical protein
MEDKAVIVYRNQFTSHLSLFVIFTNTKEPHVVKSGIQALFGIRRCEGEAVARLLAGAASSRAAIVVYLPEGYHQVSKWL